MALKTLLKPDNKKMIVDFLGGGEKIIEVA